jgi:hypothetical protein
VRAIAERLACLLLRQVESIHRLLEAQGLLDPANVFALRVFHHRMTPHRQIIGIGEEDGNSA